MENAAKEFQVRITKKGSDRAKPAIWYAWKEGQYYYVVKSSQWKTMYEVSRGKYKGRVIDPPDCVKVKSADALINSLNTKKQDK